MANNAKIEILTHISYQYAIVAPLVSLNKEARWIDEIVRLRAKLFAAEAEIQELRHSRAALLQSQAKNLIKEHVTKARETQAVNVKNSKLRKTKTGF